MLRKYKRTIKHGKRKKKKVFSGFIFFLLFVCLIFYSFYRINNRILPAVLAVSDFKTKNAINYTINSSVNNIISEMNLSSSDFYNKVEDSNGRVNSLSVNTLLVNEFCGNVAVDISENLLAMGNDVVSVPLGSLLGIDIFANHGPKYKVTILPMGNALVDYYSSFDSVGINQINFQIWLSVESTVQIINPLRKEELKIVRKLSLVNTIITGDTPNTYMNNMPYIKP